MYVEVYTNIKESVGGFSLINNCTQIRYEK